MCLLTVTLSLNVFSQTVTEIRDTSHVVLTTEVARKVAVDLLEGDAAKEQLLLLERKAEVLDSTITLQQSQIGILEKQSIAQEKLLEMYRVESVQNMQDVERLNRDLRRASTRGTIFATTTGVAVVALIVSLIFGGR